MFALKIWQDAFGNSTPFDDEFVKEYDPGCAGVSPDGRPMLCHLVTTKNPSEAKLFSNASEAFEFWRQVDPIFPVRPDGQPNRPLTAFNVSVEQVCVG